MRITAVVHPEQGGPDLRQHRFDVLLVQRVLKNRGKSGMDHGNVVREISIEAVLELDVEGAVLYPAAEVADDVRRVVYF